MSMADPLIICRAVARGAGLPIIRCRRDADALTHVAGTDVPIAGYGESIDNRKRV